MSRSLAALGGIVLVGCVRSYSPGAPRSATSGRARVSMEQLITAPPGSIAPNVGGVVIRAHYAAAPDETLGTPHLAPTSLPPCSGGVAAVSVSYNGLTSTLGAIFEGDAVEREHLFDEQPTVLDVAVYRNSGGRGCLRIPLVEDVKEPSWYDRPVFSLGWDASIAVPFRRVDDVSAIPLVNLRFGPWIGPVRLRSELGIGGAFMRSQNPNLTVYALRTGLLLDTLVLSAGRFGLGAAIGYDVVALDVGYQIRDFSHAGAGFHGIAQGPRAGLSFELLPFTPAGGAFVERPDSASGSIEIYAGALHGDDGRRTAPTLWLAFGIDVGH